MDVTSLLNVSTPSLCSNASDRDSTPFSDAESVPSGMPVAILTPPPELDAFCGGYRKKIEAYGLSWNRQKPGNLEKMDIILGNSEEASPKSIMTPSTPRPPPSVSPREHQEAGGFSSAGSKSTLNTGGDVPTSMSHHSDTDMRERLSIRRSPSDRRHTHKDISGSTLTQSNPRVFGSLSSGSLSVTPQSHPHSRISSVATIVGTPSPSAASMELQSSASRPTGAADDVASDMTETTDGLQHEAHFSPYTQRDDVRLGHSSSSRISLETASNPSGTGARTANPLHYSPSSAKPFEHAQSEQESIENSPKLHQRTSSAPDLTQPLRPVPRTSRTHSHLTLPPLRTTMVQTRSSSINESRDGDYDAKPYPTTDLGSGHDASIARAVPKDEEGESTVTALDNEQKGETSAEGRQNAVDESEQLSFSIPDDLEPIYVEALEGRNRCMFVSNCNTGSTLRKAISHFFGRNKDCTKRIPKELWVYYCRKHYQRIRYRNAKTYPLNQMELVLWQMRRLQAWDIACQRTEQAVRIEYWTFALRKREERRLKKGNGESEESDHENSLTPRDTNTTPDWVKESVGKEYSTQEIMLIAQRLHDEIMNGQLNGIPEVEFLPQITGDKFKAAKKPRRRSEATAGPSSKAPKRKASRLSNPSDEPGQHMGLVGAGHLIHDGSQSVHAYEKRPRLDRTGSFGPPVYSRQASGHDLSGYSLHSHPHQFGPLRVGTHTPDMYDPASHGPQAMPRMQTIDEHRHLHGHAQPQDRPQGISLPQPWATSREVQRPRLFEPGYSMTPAAEPERAGSLPPPFVLPPLTGHSPHDPNVRPSFYQHRPYQPLEMERGVHGHVAASQPHYEGRSPRVLPRPLSSAGSTPYARPAEDYFQGEPQTYGRSLQHAPPLSQPHESYMIHPASASEYTYANRQGEAPGMRYQAPHSAEESHAPFRTPLTHSWPAEPHSAPADPVARERVVPGVEALRLRSPLDRGDSQNI